jgi:hypothetical protein
MTRIAMARIATTMALVAAGLVYAVGPAGAVALGRRRVGRRHHDRLVDAGHRERYLVVLSCAVDRVGDGE